MKTSLKIQLISYILITIYGFIVLMSLKKTEEQPNFEGKKRFSDLLLITYVIVLILTSIMLSRYYFFSNHINKISFLMSITYYLSFCLGFKEGIIE